jgi:hypothetical protein
MAPLSARPTSTLTICIVSSRRSTPDRLTYSPAAVWCDARARSGRKASGAGSDTRRAEPPVATALPDRDAALAAARAVHETYMREGFGAGMAHFIAVVTHKGPIPADFADRPAPDPAMFGLPAEDDGTRNEPLLGQNIISGTHYELDFDALRAGWTHIVLVAGVESEGEMQPSFACPGRTAREDSGDVPKQPRGGSLAASMARPATPMPLRRSCATFSPSVDEYNDGCSEVGLACRP